jgi:hypothetical protein
MPGILRSFVTLALIAGPFCSVALVAPSIEAQVAARSEVGDDGLVKAKIDTVAARLATLEVRRAELSPVYAASSPEAQMLDRSIALLQQYLDEMPDPRAARAVANGHILRSIEARLARVSVERRLLATQYAADSPATKGLAEMEAALEKRHAEIRALMRGARSGSERE